MKTNTNEDKLDPELNRMIVESIHNVVMEAIAHGWKYGWNLIFSKQKRSCA
jgi:hypothetical protein